MGVKPESIYKLARSTYTRLVKGLKELGIDVPEIDGPSTEADLFSLQALQAVETAVSAHNEQKSLRADSLAGFSVNGEQVNAPTTTSNLSAGKK